MKTIAKYQILDQNLEKHLEVALFIIFLNKIFSLKKQEKKVLEEISHPFIMKFFQSMKDDLNIYFLTEYIKGMELFDVIRDIGKAEYIINYDLKMKILNNFLNIYFFNFCYHEKDC